MLKWSNPDCSDRKWEDVFREAVDPHIRTALIKDLVLLKVGPPSCYQDIVTASDFYLQQLKDQAKKDISVVVPIYQVAASVPRVALAERFHQFSSMSNLLLTQVGEAMFKSGGGVVHELPPGQFAT